jgi:hypothetical protein
MGIWGFKNQLLHENWQLKHALDKAVTNSELAVTYNQCPHPLVHVETLAGGATTRLKIRWYNFFLINICKAERSIICLIFY